MAKLRESLAKNIRLYRGERTQKEFAEFLGVDLSLVRRLEQGANLPQERQLAQICKTLGIEETDLFQAEPPAVVEREHDLEECVRRVTQAALNRGEKPEKTPGMQLREAFAMVGQAMRALESDEFRKQLEEELLPANPKKTGG